MGRVKMFFISLCNPDAQAQSEVTNGLCHGVADKNCMHAWNLPLLVVSTIKLKNIRVKC